MDNLGNTERSPFVTYTYIYISTHTYTYTWYIYICMFGTCTELVWYIYGTPTDHHCIRIWRFDHFLTTNYNYFFLPTIHLPLSDLVYERFYTNISVLLLISVRKLFPRVSACFMQCSQDI